MDSSRDDFVIAIRSAFLNRGNQQRFSILGLMFFSLILLIFGSFNFKVINYIKSGLSEVVYRSSFIVSGPENFIINNYQTIESHFKLYDESRINKQELEIFKSKELISDFIFLENKRLKFIIDDYLFQKDEIISKILLDKQSPFLRSVIVNKGSRDNVKLGMVVLDGEYLIGKIIDVNYLTARVLLLSDLNSKIPVQIEPSDVLSIMSGTGKRGGMIQNSEREYDILDGSTVFTSGVGGLFKGGIPVGRIKREDNTNNQQIEFFSDFSQLRFVKILSFTKEKNFISKSTKEIKEVENQINEIKRNKEKIDILLKQKKINFEIRNKIEEENSTLKNKLLTADNNLSKLENELLISKKLIEEKKLQLDEINYLKQEILYGKKCRKNFFNQLYREGSNQYRKCVLNKGRKIKN